MILPLMLLVVACQPVEVTVELTDADKAAIADTVEALNSEWLTAMAAADLDRGMTLFHEGPNVAWGYEGEIVFGFDAIVSAWRPYFEAMESQDFTVQESRVEVLAPTVACINQVITGTTTDTAGVTGPELVYAITTVWLLRDGEWKMYFGQESLPTPEAESM
jgi:uncharacterized protein (TIGR02246 family)